MKHKNLEILQANDVLVPSFFTVKSVEDYDTIKTSILDDNKKYAVRSSFGDEDSKTQSFAGQFQTILNVEKKNIRNAIKTVFESADAENVKEYAKENTKHDGCVIIQEMVDAEISGVLFTANPLGIFNEMVITVGQGLGNRIVEDKAPTTSYFYNTDDGVYCVSQQDGAPTLDKSMIKKMVELGDKIKGILGYHADVEFAIKNNQIFVLQARPITTLSGKNIIVLDNSNIVESYPGISLPLTQSFVKDIYHYIFYKLSLRMTKNQSLVNRIDIHLKDMVDVSNWRIYYRISNWYYVLKILPFSEFIIPVWQNMLGVQNKEMILPNDIKVPLSTKWTVFTSFVHYMRKVSEYMNELNDGFDAKYIKYNLMVENATTVEELMNIYHAMREDILSDWDITLLNDMYTFINTALAGKKTHAMLSDIKDLESMKPAKAMNDLIICAQRTGMNTREYEKLADEYIRVYGDRCLGELKLETKTYRSNPELLEAYVKRQISDTSVTTIQMSSGSHSRNAYVNKAKTGIKNREISRLNRSRLFGIIRSLFLKAGAILAADGYLELPNDIFYIKVEEIFDNSALKEIVAQRKIDEVCYRSLPAYSRIVFDGKVFDKKNAIVNTQVLETANVLCGIASSSGLAKGEVLIVEEPSDSIDTTGKILVTKSTDPGWVFLIKNAVGIIAEKGSLLSHTAIISRELGKPAIVNVKDCTKILKNGYFVELDAENGVVRIMGRNGN